MKGRLKRPILVDKSRLRTNSQSVKIFEIIENTHFNGASKD